MVIKIKDMFKRSKKAGKGQALYTKAKNMIPGGTQLLSKRPEMFLPNLWPAYYKKAKGYNVWDMDGTKYLDFATMGIGACSLGYSDKYVNKKVINAINDGSMTTLNCYEEVKLAERLTDLHPWSQMARFSRGGGEACSIAARIARAATGKDKILFCGYHGWHDWYISANIQSKENLNQQLLSGLDSKGVPSYLEGTAIPFLYNDILMFKNLVSEHSGEIAAVFMEPVRGNPPEDGFLESIRDICSEQNIVLIFDEVTSGFRKNPGGVHLTYGINPDIAVFGKALGNGFPISAVIGRSEIMSAAQDTFISSTFWTERVGYVAALATIEKFIKHNVHEHLIEMGNKVNSSWMSAAENSKINISIDGLEPLTHINFDEDQASTIQTIYTQEMLKKNFLVGANVYSSFAYDQKAINKFSDAVHKVFNIIKKAIKSGQPNDFLDSEEKHSGFKRLT
jgi:glutamate-1-semialdehyde aminotransferase